jgi:processive 1,2-diacylglycerol beta-glucosyltransferase
VILHLTAGFGDGHNTAARNVAQGLARLAPEEPTRIVDLSDEAHPVLSPVAKGGYQMMITRIPWLWGKIFRNTAKQKIDRRTDWVVGSFERALDERLRREKPRAIVCTYLMFQGALQNLREKGRALPPVFTVITDSITIHPLWLLGPSDRYYVADEDSKAGLARLGVGDADIVVSGFPVNLDFMDEPQAPPPRPQGRILYLPSTGECHVRRTLEALRPLLERGTQLTLPLGKHYSRLYHVATRFVDSLPGASIEVLGWTPQIPRLLQTHDLVICKAGGAILHEALAARCPAIIDYIVPGQEEGNAELLTKHECGVVTHSPAETGIQAARLLANDRAEARRMKENTRPQSLPQASLTIARDILARIGAGTVQAPPP